VVRPLNLLVDTSISPSRISPFPAYLADQREQVPTTS